LIARYSNMRQIIANCPQKSDFVWKRWFILQRDNCNEFPASRDSVSSVVGPGSIQPMGVDFILSRRGSRLRQLIERGPTSFEAKNLHTSQKYAESCSDVRLVLRIKRIKLPKTHSPLAMYLLLRQAKDTFCLRCALLN
jgi:hypothetical protein